ncbi:MAG: ferredoxin-thioredoxin reductase catalytic domain-containing protein [Coriobacteriales bacterium]
MNTEKPVRRRFAPGTTADDLKEFMEPFVDHLGYKFNTEHDFVEEVLASEIEILEREGDIYCPCRMRTGDPKEDVAVICPCIPFHTDEFAAIKKCWCGLFILKDVEDGADLLGVIDEPTGPVDVPVFKVEDLPSGQVRHVKIGKRDIAVAHAADGFYALSDICRHAFAPLSDGFMEGHVLVCPWHGWRYDVRTGSTDHPDSDVRTYPTKVVGGEVFVTVPPRRQT